MISLSGYFKKGVIDVGYQRNMHTDVVKFNTARLSAEDVIGDQEYKELYDKVTAYIDQHDLEDSMYWDEIQTFTEKYEGLINTRSKVQRIRNAIEQRAQFSGMGGGYDAEMSAYYPKEYGKAIPKKGCWIIIIREIPVEEKMRPSLYGVYYALPEYTTHSISISDKIEYPIKRLKAKINTENGETMILPHEYTVVQDIADVIAGTGVDGEYEMVKLGGDATYDNAKVHYLLTRGIPKEETYNLLLGDVGTINFCYFKIKPECFEQYDFIMSCLFKGIDLKMANRLWHHKVTGIPLFTLKKADNDQTQSDVSKDRKEDNLNPIKLNLKAGSSTAVLGPNGSGKSTLIGVLSHNPMIKADGDMEVDAPLFVGFQKPVEIPELTAMQLLLYLAQPLTRLEFFDKHAAILSILELTEEMLDRKLNIGLSGGENKRLELLQMYIVNPKVLLLDEIDTGLDIDALVKMGNFLQQWIAEHNPTILVATHNLQFLHYFGVTKVIILKDGAIALQGDKSLIKKLERQGFSGIINQNNYNVLESS
jgi:Fe-S cluster assembly ATP-binding protein